MMKGGRVMGGMIAVGRVISTANLSRFAPTWASDDDAVDKRQPAIFRSPGLLRRAFDAVHVRPGAEPFAYLGLDRNLAADLAARLAPECTGAAVDVRLARRA